jgi:hypothetical protein
VKRDEIEVSQCSCTEESAAPAQDMEMGGQETLPADDGVADVDRGSVGMFHC